MSLQQMFQNFPEICQQVALPPLRRRYVASLSCRCCCGRCCFGCISYICLHLPLHLHVITSPSICMSSPTPPPPHCPRLCLRLSLLFSALFSPFPSLSTRRFEYSNTLSPQHHHSGTDQQADPFHGIMESFEPVCFPSFSFVLRSTHSKGELPGTSTTL